MDGSFIFETNDNINAKMKIKIHQRNNKYKKEKILVFLQDFIDELKEYCKKYNGRLIEELNGNVHDQKKLENIEDGLNITEMFNFKNNTTDRDVEKFICASKAFISRYKRKISNKTNL